MNLTLVINGVIERIVSGQRVRIRAEYRDEIISQLAQKYPDMNIEVECEDTYCFIHRTSPLCVE